MLFPSQVYSRSIKIAKENRDFLLTIYGRRGQYLNLTRELFFTGCQGKFLLTGRTSSLTAHTPYCYLAVASLDTRSELEEVGRSIAI